MPALPVVAVLRSAEGKADVLRDALQALVAPTREEQGCLAYDLYESASTPGTFVTVESWRSQDDLDLHMQTPHIQQAFASAGDALADAGIHPLVPVS